MAFLCWGSILNICRDLKGLFLRDSRYFDVDGGAGHGESATAIEGHFCPQEGVRVGGGDKETWVNVQRKRQRALEDHK